MTFPIPVDDGLHIGLSHWIHAVYLDGVTRPKTCAGHPNNKIISGGKWHMTAAAAAIYVIIHDVGQEAIIANRRQA
jgi:hypothetical protein